MNQPSDKTRDLWIGIGISIGIYLLGLLILFVYGSMFFPYLLIAVIAHLVLPIVSFAKGKTRFGQGVLIGVGLNVLLFSACFGLIFMNLGG